MSGDVFVGSLAVGLSVDFQAEGGPSCGKAYPQGAGDARSLMLPREELLRCQLGGA